MTDMIDLGEDKSPLLSLVQQAVFEDNLFKKLNAVDIIISALDETVATKTKAKEMKKFIHTEVLSNEKYMRKLQMFARIADNHETAIEYFGQDYITHPEFNFDSEFQNRLSMLNRRVNHFIGELIKELSESEGFEL